jgi:type IV secretion system protein VirB10
MPCPTLHGPPLAKARDGFKHGSLLSENYRLPRVTSQQQSTAGLQDGTDYHWGGVLKAALVSTLLGAGSELGSGDDGNLARAFRRGTQDSINRAGEQIVSRELRVFPQLDESRGIPKRPDL